MTVIDFCRLNYKEVMNEHMDNFLEEYKNYVDVEKKLRAEAEEDLVGAYTKVKKILPQITELKKSAEKEQKKAENSRDSWDKHPNKFDRTGVYNEQVRKEISRCVKEVDFWIKIGLHLSNCICELEEIEKKYKAEELKAAHRRVTEIAEKESSNPTTINQNDGR